MPTEPGRGRDQAAHRTVSPTVRRWVVGVGILLVLWFLFAWLILDRHVLDAAGESVGTAFALGVVVSLVGALRSSR
jgi:hypothetical protein